MAIISIDIYQFLTKRATCPVVDVRSPSEYAHAHIPGAYNVPLFTDEERKIVGTIYKQESRENAIKAGLKFFGPQMVSMIEEIETLTANKKICQVVISKITKQKKRYCCIAGGAACAVPAWPGCLICMALRYTH